SPERNGSNVVTIFTEHFKHLLITFSLYLDHLLCRFCQVCTAIIEFVNGYVHLGNMQLDIQAGIPFDRLSDLIDGRMEVAPVSLQADSVNRNSLLLQRLDQGVDFLPLVWIGLVVV